jgi:SAM-dependent methyltransferase
MDRIQEILKFAKKTDFGIEIAPYHSPIAPKKDGWNSLSLDVFDTERLKKNASLDPDPHVIASAHRIEEVDIVSSAVEIEKAVTEKYGHNSFDYVISSHNFEHLPNPIKFLKGCGQVLRQNGMLSMAIPNKRKTFDFYRSQTTTAELLKLYFSNADRPDPFQIFDFRSRFSPDGPANKREFSTDIYEAFEGLISSLRNPDDNYIDTHVTVFTPENFLLLMLELQIIGLIPLSVVGLKVNGIEFIVHMKNVGYQANLANRNAIKAARANFIKTQSHKFSYL